jgi:hypothetical protein
LFFLAKTDDIWTLHYEVSGLRRILLFGAGLGGLGIGMFQVVEAHPSGRSVLVAIAAGALCLALMGYWTLSDAATTAAFDLMQRRIEVRSERPWFGPPRVCAFSEVAGLYAVSRSGETVDSWEAILELADGTRIRLGREAEGGDERIRQYIEEIRRVTGIAGS